MQKRYNFIILGILLIGLIAGAIWALSQENEHTVEPKDRQEKEEQEKSEPEEEEKDRQTDAEKEAEEEPISELGEIISEAVQQTIDLFTNKETHVVAIGDSLTQGVGDQVVEGGYVSILDKAINQEDNKLVTFENYGKRGIRSDQLLERLHKPEIAQSVRQADIVLITIGANDIMKVVKENFTDLSLKDFSGERTDYKDRLKAIIDRIDELNSGAEIYLLGFYNPFEKYFKDLKELGIIVENWNKVGQTLAEEYEDVTYIPTEDLFDDPNTDLFSEDNFHPNHLGYQRMAQRVLEYITE
ncbi:SGNH/GDSL hydrolase family protein [Virgibacillus kekensis]|uniref:SGNH/GDSL hydrolase family protein n=1 Tax=Virgibacillus kekensis TaxID=202261 RepID=A0ABV9DH50_9BACI